MDETQQHRPQQSGTQQSGSGQSGSGQSGAQQNWTSQNWTQQAARLVDLALDRTIAPGYTSIGYAVRRKLPTWPDDPAPRALRGRHWIVTGASSGLGVQSAKDLAEFGAFVHLVVRNETKAEPILAALEAEFGPRFRLWVCDLSDLDSVMEFTRKFGAEVPKLHGIVHNAGLMPPSRQTSAQGFELSMAIHVLGPIAMTEELLPNLRGNDARVIFVTSGGMYAQRLRADDPDYVTEQYAPARAYARSKRAQVELLETLNLRWSVPGVRVYATHPGWAATPGVDESLPLFGKITGPFLRNLSAGTDTTSWLAAIQPAPPGGGLWHDRQERPKSLTAATTATPAQRSRMWDWVCRSLGWVAGKAG